MTDRGDMGEIADGMALWEEYRPRTAEDWVGVVERWVKDDAPTTNSSPIFAAAVRLQNRVLEQAREVERLRNALGVIAEYRIIPCMAEVDAERLKEIARSALDENHPQREDQS